MKEHTTKIILTSAAWGGLGSGTLFLLILWNSFSTKLPLLIWVGICGLYLVYYNVSLSVTRRKFIKNLKSDFDKYQRNAEDFQNDLEAQTQEKKL